MKTVVLAFIVVSCLSTGLFAEEVLRVKPRETKKERPPKKITQDTDLGFDELKPSQFLVTSAQFHVVTPLVHEIFPEKCFRAWGNVFSISFYLAQLNKKVFLHLEPGLGVTLIRLSLSQPTLDFSHVFLHFPVRGRLIYEINRKFFTEAFAGIVLHPWEYDSRDTPDGGFRRTTTDTISFDAGLGAGVFLNENFFGRLCFGIQWLVIGFGVVI